MKRILVFIVSFYCVASFSQVTVERNAQTIGHEKYLGQKSGYIGDDDSFYYVFLERSHRENSNQIQKFSKKNNQLIYSVPLNSTFDFIPILLDKYIYAVYYDYNKKEKRWEISCRKIEKETGMMSDEILVDTYDSPKETDNKLFHYFFGDNLLIGYENVEEKKPQNTHIRIFHLADFGKLSEKTIPTKINGAEIFTYQFSINKGGDIAFLYYKTKNQKELNLFRAIRYPYLNYSSSGYSGNQIKDMVMYQAPSIGFISAQDSIVVTKQLNVPDTVYVVPYNIRINYENNIVNLSGIYKGRCTGSYKNCDAGFFNIVLSPNTIEKELFQPFIISKKIKENLSGNYELLDTIIDKGNIYSIYQLYFISAGMDYRKSMIVSKFNIASFSYEWMRVIPYSLENQAIYFGLDIGVNAFVYEDNLYLLHLDNPENRNNINEFNPNSVRSFKLKEADLVYEKIDRNGIVSKTTLASNSDYEFACPGGKTILLDKNKILLFIRGENENGGYDKYNAVIVK